MKTFIEFIKEAMVNPTQTDSESGQRINPEEKERNTVASGGKPTTNLQRMIQSKTRDIPDDKDFDALEIDPPKGSEETPSNHITPQELNTNPPSTPKGRFAP